MTMLAGNLRTSSPSVMSGQQLVLMWSISPQAVVGAGLAESCEGAFLEIELPAPGQRGPVTPRLVIDGQCRELSMSKHAAPEARWQLDRSTQRLPHAALMHLDVPGVLQITARTAPTIAQVLYARTSLLTELGIGGGRYDFEGAEAR